MGTYVMYPYIESHDYRALVSQLMDQVDVQWRDIHQVDVQWREMLLPLPITHRYHEFLHGAI